MAQGFAFQTQRPVSVFLAPWARDYALPWKLEIMPERRNHLLVIGINQYQDKAWPSLNAAVANCGNLCDVLLSRYEGFYPENCVTLYNNEATLHNIVSTLDRLGQELDPHDNLIIVYAGHTFLDPKSGDRYWVPVDARISETQSLFPLGVLREFWSKTRAFHVLLLMDAVLSGNGNHQDDFTDKTDPIAFNPDPADQPSRWALLPGQAQPDPASLLASVNRLLQENPKDYLNLLQVARNAEQGLQLFQLEQREQTAIGQFGFYLKRNAQQAHTEEAAQQSVPKTFYVRFSPEMRLDEANTASIQREIQAAWQMNPPKYMAWSTEGQQPDFEIHWLEGKYDRELILTKPGSRTPLFISQRFPGLFMEALDKFSRFENLLRLPEAPAALRKQFEVQVEVMEGEAFDSNNLNRLFNPKSLPSEHYKKLINPESVELKYLPVNEDMQPPAIKVNISYKGRLPRDYWVGALYGDTQLGVDAKLLPVQNIRSVVGGMVKMEFSAGGQKWDALPIHIDSALKAGGATVFKDHIILFVAEQNFDLTMYEQSPIQLEPVKGMGFLTSAMEGGFGKAPLYTIKIPILIHYPQLPVHSNSRQGNVFPGFELRNAYNRSARVQATDLRSAKRKVQLLTESGIAHNPGVFLPPDELWKGLSPSEDTFVPTPLAASDGCISILEFTQVDGDWSEEFPIEIIPDARLAQDETILPFAYDESSGLYYPVGYTNENGVILITKMPAPTPGMIGLEGLAETRAQNSSVKLFFRKFRWNRLSGSPRPATLTLLQKNTLAITRREYKGNPEEEEIRTEIQRTLSSRPNVILLVPGFIGDFMDMALAVFEGGRENTVLVFTYDTLSTPMDAAARALQNLLNNCLSPQHSIMTVAHSTGGLLARRWVEFEGGNTRCQSLLLVGTPHGGISQSLLQKRLFRLFAAAMNRWEISNEDKNLLLFAGRILNNPRYKLGIELNLHGEFIQTLRYSTPKGINYSLFIGDDAILDKQEAEMDPSPILKRLSLYDTEDGHRNDLVFDVDSMGEINNKSAIVKSHHLGYFYHQEVLNLLSEMTKPA